MPNQIGGWDIFSGDIWTLPCWNRNTTIGFVEIFRKLIKTTRPDTRARLGWGHAPLPPCTQVASFSLGRLVFRIFVHILGCTLVIFFVALGFDVDHATKTAVSNVLFSTFSLFSPPEIVDISVKESICLAISQFFVWHLFLTDLTVFFKWVVCGLFNDLFETVVIL